MGGCLSGDLKGGKQGVGGNQEINGGGHNEAVDFFFRSRGFEPLFAQVELSLSATKLIDLDIMSKSDPMAVLYLKKSNGQLEEVGRTEVILNNLNPSWIQKISIAYHFESLQPLVIRIYDVDTKFHNVAPKSIKLADQDFLGEGNCFLSEILTQRNRTLSLRLQNTSGRTSSRNLGTLTIHAEETIASRTSIELKFRCSLLTNKDFLSLSDPFLRISRIVESGDSVPICKTEVINDNLNPAWKSLSLSMQQFGSKENPLIIECFDFNSNGNHILIGKLQQSVADLERLHRERSGANLILPTKDGGEKVLKSQLFVDQFLEKEQYSFIDYISSGVEISFLVAVDYTASNGDPRLANSLHHIDHSGNLNSYQKAIMEVGEVIQFYDSDKLFPAWGFGARLPSGTVSHCFNLNGSLDNSEVVGVEGIMSSYATSLHNVSLAGPTLFSQVIDKAAQIAGQSVSSNCSKYFVLLIMTDGIVSNLQETIDALVKASDLPLSILIVGVGNADFKAMEILDADNGRRSESSTGRIATRDIVQFVPMREVLSGRLSVAQTLLEELPWQFLSYMRSRGHKPLNRY